VQLPLASPLFPYTTLFRSRFGRGGRTAPRLHDLLSGVEEQLAHGDALVEQASGVAPQIEHQRLHPLLDQAAHGVRELLGGRLARSEEHTSELQSRSELVCR